MPLRTFQVSGSVLTLTQPERFLPLKSGTNWAGACPATVTETRRLARSTSGVKDFMGAEPTTGLTEAHGGIHPEHAETAKNAVALLSATSAISARDPSRTLRDKVSSVSEAARVSEVRNS